MAKKGSKLGSAFVDIWARVTKLDKGMVGARKIVARGMKSLVRVVKIGAVAIGAAMTYGFIKAVKAASDAQEIQAKFGTVFKALTDDANAWAKEYGKTVGRATQDVKRWMSGLQDLFVPLGMTRKKAFELDKQIVKLAVDVASFNNEVDDVVLRDFTSALIGNHETVRKYGIMISELSLKQEALNQGITKNFTQLTNLEKVQLRYSLIVKGSTDANEDAVRTGDSYANQVKRLKGNITNLAEALGTKLLPKMTEIVTKSNEWIAANQELIKQKFGEFVTASEKKLAKLGDAMSWVGKHATGLKIALGTVVAGFVALKVTAVIGAFIKLWGLIAKVGGAFKWLGQGIVFILGKFGGIEGILWSISSAVKSLAAAFTFTGAAIASLVAIALAGLTAVFTTIMKIIYWLNRWRKAKKELEDQDDPVVRQDELDEQRNKKIWAKKQLEKKQAERKKQADLEAEKTEKRLAHSQMGLLSPEERVAKEGGKAWKEKVAEAANAKIQSSLDSKGATKIAKDKNVSSSFVGLQEMWKNLSTGMRPIDKKNLDLNTKQLAEQQKMNKTLEAISGKTGGVWSP